MQFLKANTAVDVLIGPFVDSTDGNTTEDGLTISQADVKLSKNGQALAQKNDATACAFDDDGYYNCELDATDTNTEGNLVLIVHESGALAVRHEFNVLAESAYDSLFAAKDTGYMDVNVKAYNDQTATTSTGNIPDVNVAEISDGGTEADRLQAALGNGNYIDANTTLIEGGDATDALDSACNSVTVTSIGNDVITAASINTGALSADAFAADALAAATFATGAFTADAFAADALTAATFATGAFTADAFAADALVAATFAASSLDGKGDWNTTVPDAAGTAATPADVNAQVLDVLNVDTFAEPGQGAPSATPTIRQMVHYLYKGWRNKSIQDATTYELYDDAGTTVDQKATISDDGTDFTKGEIGTGP